MKITETIYDILTKETTIVERELTPEQIAEYEQARAESASIEAEAKALAEAKAAAEAKLAALGLTADDLKALGL